MTLEYFITFMFSNHGQKIYIPENQNIRLIERGFPILTFSQRPAALISSINCEVRRHELHLSSFSYSDVFFKNFSISNKPFGVD